MVFEPPPPSAALPDATPEPLPEVTHEDPAKGPPDEPWEATLPAPLATRCGPGDGKGAELSEWSVGCRAELLSVEEFFPVPNLSRPKSSAGISECRAWFGFPSRIAEMVTMLTLE